MDAGREALGFTTQTAYTKEVSIRDNLQRVREQLETACHQAERASTEVKLMAVSKTHPAEAIQEAWEAGQRLFGENRVQEMQAKLPALAGVDGAEFHLIGPLQNNKTAKATELFQTVDTLDSLKTAERLNEAAGRLGKVLPVLIEVKLSPEESKHGLAPEALAELAGAISQLPNLSAYGLMTVPPMTEDPEQARPYFRKLRELRESLVTRYPSLTELSMGMSGDFTVAIEEGSTMIRVGTAIFGRRESA